MEMETFLREKYSRASRSLVEFLGLAQPPVALCFAKSVPGGVPEHSGRVAAGCRFWQDGASASFFTSAPDHSMCAVGVYTHSLAPSPGYDTDLHGALKMFEELGYLRQEDIGSVPVLPSQPEFILYSPLAETPQTPDVVLLFVNARQSLILSEAAQQVDNRNPPAMGRPACAVVPQVMNSGASAFSFGCCGARAYLDLLTDETAIFAIPGDKLEHYVDRVATLAQANAALSKFHRDRRKTVETVGS
jgi:uncharacterized protein (DUF169 family)